MCIFRHLFSHSFILYMCISTSLELLFRSCYLGHSCMDIVLCRVSEHSAFEQVRGCFSDFLCYCSKILDQRNIRREGLVLVHQGRHGSRSMELLASNQKVESNEHSCSDSCHLLWGLGPLPTEWHCPYQG